MARLAPGVDLLFPDSNSRIVENIQQAASVRKFEKSPLGGSTQNGTPLAPKPV
jgi:hypothetical protein